MKILKKTYSDLQSKEFNDNEKSIVHYISTESIDAYNEVLKANGMDDSKFKAVLWQHSRGRRLFDDATPKPSSLVIGKSAWRKIEDNYGVLAKTIFADTPLGRDVYKFNKEGYINSWSVGWSEKSAPKVVKQLLNDKEVEVKIFETWNLHEYSSVIFPANNDAINLMIKSAEDDRLADLLNEDLMFKEMSERLAQFKNELNALSELKQNIELNATLRTTIEEIQKQIKEINDKLISESQLREIVAVNKHVSKKRLTQDEIDALVLKAYGGAIRKLTGRNIKIS